MAKLPYMQFYPADYLRDTRCLSLAARGVWMDLICVLWHAKKRGQRTLSLEGWAGEIGKPPGEVEIYLIEIDGCGVCEINRENLSQITIKCRRMLRDERVRRLAAARQQKQRDSVESRTESRERHTDVTGIYQKSDIRSQKSESYSDEEKKEDKTPIPPRGALVVLDDFDIFWNAYPKKKGKDAARRRWRKLGGARPVLEVMLNAIRQQKDSEQWKKDNGQYIPHPSTWLHEGRWADEPTEVTGMSDPNGFLSGMQAFLERHP